MEKNEFDPLKELANMNFVERVFFWASFDKASGSKESYGKLLLISLYERTRNLIIGLIVIIGIIVIVGFIGSLFNPLLENHLKESQEKEQQETRQYFKQKALEGNHDYDEYLKY